MSYVFQNFSIYTFKSFIYILSPSYWKMHTFSLFISYYNYFIIENRFIFIFLSYFAVTSICLDWIHAGRLYTQPYKLKDRHCKMGEAESPCFFYNGWVSVPLLRTTLLTRRFSTITRRAERVRVSNGKGDAMAKRFSRATQGDWCIGKDSKVKAVAISTIKSGIACAANQRYSGSNVLIVHFDLLK